MNKYRVYSTVISCDFKIPFLDKINSNAPYEISIKKFSKANIKNYKNSLDLTKGSIYKKNVGYIEISDGRHINYKLLGTSSINDLSKLILNHGIAYAFFQRKYFVLHASAICKDDYAYIFSGISGNGKSSIVLDLINKYKFITEDIGIINFKNNAYIRSSFPFIKISTNRMNNTSSLMQEEFNFDSDKMHRSGFILNHDYFSKRQKKIKKCFFMNWGKEFSIKKMSTEEKLVKFLENSFKSLPYNSDKYTNSVQFMNISRAINSIDCFYLTRKKNDNDISIIDKILD